MEGQALQLKIDLSLIRNQLQHLQFRWHTSSTRRNEHEGEILMKTNAANAVSKITNETRRHLE
jgi:hypothetical protein